MKKNEESIISLHPRPLLPPPPRLLRNHLGRSLADPQDRHHRVHTRHLRKHARVRNPQSL